MLDLACVGAAHLAWLGMARLGIALLFLAFSQFFPHCISDQNAMGCIKHRNPKQTCLFVDRLFLARLFLVRLMYRVCIANMPFRQFLKHCFSDKNSKQAAIQNAMCFLLVCLSVGFALV